MNFLVVTRRMDRGEDAIDSNRHAKLIFDMVLGIINFPLYLIVYIIGYFAERRDDRVEGIQSVKE